MAPRRGVNRKTIPKGAKKKTKEVKSAEFRQDDVAVLVLADCDGAASQRKRESQVGPFDDRRRRADQRALPLVEILGLYERGLVTTAGGRVCHRAGRITAW